MNTTDHTDLIARLLTGDRDVACLEAASALESADARIAELERGEILTDKELVGAVIECVMSVTQSNRDLHCRKLQRHILAVEAERDAREEECERNDRYLEELRAQLAALAAKIAELEAERDSLRDRVAELEGRLAESEAKALAAFFFVPDETLMADMRKQRDECKEWLTQRDSLRERVKVLEERLGETPNV